MSVIRVVKNKNYTCMANYHLRDKSLSLKAKGLLSVILSLPDNWKYSMAGLVAICKEGESSVKAAFKELQKAGFITVKKLYPNQTKTGRIEYVYTIHEEPQKQGGCEQGVENEGVVFEEVENEGQLNTDVLNTNQTSTDRQNKENEKKAIASEVVEYLNEKAGRRFKSTKSTLRLISARLSEGYSLEDFKKVIDSKCREWLGTEWERYIQPSTLFAPSHFDEYLNAARPIGTRKSACQTDGDFSEYVRTDDVYSTWEDRSGKMPILRS